MPSRRNISGIFVAVVLLGGCRAQQLRHDQDMFRATLLDMYTNQVMDNLVRAYNGLPIVQLDYSRATGTITHQGGGSFGFVHTAAASITNTFSAGASAQQTNQLTVTAEPVLNNNEVYNAYLEFLQPDADRGPRLLMSSEPPPCEAAHVVQECDGCYYWVPIDFKYDFLRLALVTTVQRGQPLSAPEHFEVTISRIEPRGAEPEFENQFIITFSKKLFNDSGSMFVSLGGKKYVFPLQAFGGRDGDVNLGQKTNQLLLVYNPADPLGPRLPVAEFLVQLQGEPAKIKLDHHYPSIPTTENLLKSIHAETELFRLNQVGPR